MAPRTGRSQRRGPSEDMAIPPWRISVCVWFFLCISAPHVQGHVQKPTAAPASQRLSIGYFGMYAMGVK